METHGRPVPWLFQTHAKATIDLLATDMSESAIVRRIRHSLNPVSGRVDSAVQSAVAGLADHGEGESAKKRRKSQPKSGAKQLHPAITAESFFLTGKVPLGGGKYRNLLFLDVVMDCVNGVLGPKWADQCTCANLKKTAFSLKRQLVSQSFEFAFKKAVILCADEGELREYSKVYDGVKNIAQHAVNTMIFPTDGVRVLDFRKDHDGGDASVTSAADDSTLMFGVIDKLDAGSGAKPGGPSAAFAAQLCRQLIDTNNTAFPSTPGNLVGLVPFVGTASLSLPLRFQPTYRSFEKHVLDAVLGSLGQPKDQDGMIKFLVSTFSVALEKLVTPMWTNVPYIINQYNEIFPPSPGQPLPDFALLYFSNIDDVLKMSKFRV